MNFAERLKSLRERKNVTQQAVADYLGVSRTAVTGYENLGKQPNIEGIIKIAKYFNVTTDYLLGHSDRDFEADSAAHFRAKVNEAFSLKGKSPVDEHNIDNISEALFSIYMNAHKYSVEIPAWDTLLKIYMSFDSLFYYIDKANELFPEPKDRQNKVNYFKANAMPLSGMVQDDFDNFASYCYDLMEERGLNNGEHNRTDK